jgi:hypothetical protein
MKLSDLQQYAIGSVNGAIPIANGGFVKVADVAKLLQEHELEHLIKNGPPLCADCGHFLAEHRFGPKSCHCEHGGCSCSSVIARAVET